MDHDTFLLLLGEATARGQQVELCTTQVLARAMGVSESEARRVTSSMTQKAALERLENLAHEGVCGSLDPAALLAWVETAKEANKVRNGVIHTAWITDEKSGEPAYVLTRESQIVPRSEGELRSDIEVLKLATVGALQLIDMVGL